MTQHPPTQLRQLQGRVVSVKTPQTVVIEVMRTGYHPKYHKVLLRHKRFQVHDPHGKCRVGDLVTFQACRPISRTKRWRVIYDDHERKT